jgi:hypothetical protein
VRRALARCVLLVLLAVPAVVSAASPCAACSCAPRSPERVFRHADAAFVGSVVAEQVIDPTTTVQTFEVRTVYKGPLGPTVDVIAPIGTGGGSTCAVLYGPGEVAVILYRQGDGWTTDACSRITAEQLHRLASSPAHPSPSPVATPTVSLVPAARGPGGVGWPTAILGLLAGIGAIAAALAVATRRGREPHAASSTPRDGSPTDDAADAGPSG